ncbi:MerR family transcriptional regulator [Kribbella sp. NBC_00382]|uniref:MerR family transcriptional regulator n=1 Tax=Kribbella sp. NBC_00382 TaxID=2975967 RepID=UPI002E1E0FEF
MSEAASPRDTLTAAVLPVGQVSTLLGIPTVTLRSWEARYGLEPSGRTPGLHRRYTLADVDRFRRMQRLIAAGISAGDAARLSEQPDSANHATSPNHSGQRLLDTAETLALAELADLLDGSLATYGVSRAWTELIAPAFRALGSRYEQQRDCTDIELILARSVEAAVERYLQNRRPQLTESRPTLLVHCPEERHTMPLTVLRATLLEQGQSVVLLGPEATEAAILQSVPRAAPQTVVLWATARRPGQLRLRNLVTATGFTTMTAGPGWPPSAQPLADLRTATKALTTSR